MRIWSECKARKRLCSVGGMVQLQEFWGAGRGMVAVARWWRVGASLGVRLSARRRCAPAAPRPVGSVFGREGAGSPRSHHRPPNCRLFAPGFREPNTASVARIGRDRVLSMMHSTPISRRVPRRRPASHEECAWRAGLGAGAGVGVLYTILIPGGQGSTAPACTRGATRRRPGERRLSKSRRRAARPAGDHRRRSAPGSGRRTYWPAGS